jgi:hypothetical protein
MVILPNVDNSCVVGDSKEIRLLIGEAKPTFGEEGGVSLLIGDLCIGDLKVGSGCLSWSCSIVPKQSCWEFGPLEAKARLFRFLFKCLGMGQWNDPSYL